MFEKSIVKEVCETDSQIWAVPVFIYNRSRYKQQKYLSSKNDLPSHSLFFDLENTELFIP